MNVHCMDCQHEVAPGAMGRCPACHGVLQPTYAADAVQSLATIPLGRGIDRYRALLPARSALPTLGEGDTPLLQLARENAFLKVEGANPSGAFKDRAGALAAALARDAGSEGIVTASSGNAASAISAFAAAAGLPCLVLMEPGSPPAKLRQTLATGARVVLVEGVFSHGPDAIADLIAEIAQRLNYYLAFVWAPVNPYILEGIKTIAYEIVAQLNAAPDVVVCPVGGGDLFTAVWRGFKEVQQAGLIAALPRMIGVQSESAPPLLSAFRAGLERVATLDYANSRVSGINVPFSGDHALATVRESGGAVCGVRDEKVFAGQAALASEDGIWVEPAGAVAFAALADLRERREISASDVVVCISSGAGFKDARLAAAAADAVGASTPFPFDPDEIVHHVLETND